MNVLVLLRCHRDPALCRDRVALLRAQGLEGPVHALFGGADEDYATFRAELGDAVDGCTSVPRRALRWKWMHGDLALAAWFRTHGHALAFDRLIFWEWDLLGLAPFTELYRAVPPAAVGFTGLAPLAEVEARWSWSRSAAWQRGWSELRAKLAAEHGFAGPYWASQGPGLCVPRSFLECFAELDPPALAHDEVRLPAYAAALGFPLADNGWLRAWADPREALHFNCDGTEIASAAIEAELARPAGRRVFHPVRCAFPWRGRPSLATSVSSEGESA